MKKNRNAFFNEPNPMYYNPQMNMPPNYYNHLPNNFEFDDLNERIAKIERQITRLEKKINKLEASIVSPDDYDTNSNNMYML